ncbi:uncharacterized protein BT62DRAFT_991596 [Guyanagaster necrorhizus]|uniref:Uncharacterized protein n=1 Tax=Guyanagaster necrorhizus TaxID=856835 RepID=A0A9P7W1A0_9AGAR|nr:uncharacterized protein BT62DRAFT_991596 [Guyanagaster necrorhizus MCA 3950]KAG7450767.1 hypothetical protein BT62DRAFT_991596 [Guyanagaster necrorhizus MCA 3950]
MPLEAICRWPARREGLCTICLTRCPKGPQGELSVFTSCSLQRNGAEIDDEGELDRDESGVILSAVACRRGSPEVMRTLERNRTLRFLIAIGEVSDGAYGLSVWESSAADELVTVLCMLLISDSGTLSTWQNVWVGERKGRRGKSRGYARWPLPLAELWPKEKFLLYLAVNES